MRGRHLGGGCLGIDGGQFSRPDNGLPVHPQTFHRGNRAENEGGDRVCDTGVPQAVPSPQHHVGELAGFDGADTFLAAQCARAAQRGHLECLSSGERRRSAGGTRHQHRLMRFFENAAGFVRGRSVHTQADRDTRRQKVTGAGGSGTEAAVGRRAVRHRTPGGGQSRDRVVVEVDPVCKPDISAQPADRFHVFDRCASETLCGIGGLVLRLGQMCVQTYSPLSGEFGRGTEQVGSHRER